MDILGLLFENMGVHHTADDTAVTGAQARLRWSPRILPPLGMPPKRSPSKRKRATPVDDSDDDEKPEQEKKGDGKSLYDLCEIGHLHMASSPSTKS